MYVPSVLSSGSIPDGVPDIVLIGVIVACAAIVILGIFWSAHLWRRP